MTVSATTVTQYYTGIFRQAPTAAVSSAYQAMANDQAALNSMLSAANIQVDPVVRLYQTAFNRLPDTNGMTAWVVPFSTGQITLQAIANGFTQSTEFTTLYPSTLSNAQFVGALYWNILQRAGEDAGIKGWTNALDSGALTRAQVLLGFSDSAEFTAKVEPNVNVFLRNIATTPIAQQSSAALYSGNLFDQNGGAPSETFTLSTNVDTVNVTKDNALITGTQTTFQTLDTINGNSYSNLTLKLTDTGTSAWTVPGANVNGIQNIVIQNANGTGAVAGVTETGTVTAVALSAGQTLTVAGQTLLATADLTASQVAAALAGTATSGTGYTLAGALTGWTKAAGSAGTNTIVYTSTTATAPVADLTLSGTAQSGAPAVTVLNIGTAAADGGNVYYTLTYNGNTVRTSEVAGNSTAATQAAAIASAINGYAGKTIATANSAQVTVVANPAVNLGSFTSVAVDGTITTGAVVTYGLALAKQTIVVSDAGAGITGTTTTFVYNGVSYTTATHAATVAGITSAVVDKLNSVAGAAIASVGTSGALANDAVVINYGAQGANIVSFASTGAAFAAPASTTVSSGQIAASPTTVVTVQGVAPIDAQTYTDTIDASKFAGSMTFVSEKSTGAVTINELSTQTVGKNGGSGNLTANYKASATQATVDILGKSTAGNIAVDGSTLLKTIVINSAGSAANTVGTVTLGDSATALTIAAGVGLQTGNITGFTGTTATITATGIAGDIAATATNAAKSAVTIGTIENTTVKTIDASAMTNGGVEATLSTNASITFIGGQGSDRITTGAVLAADGSVDAGAGTDRLIVANSAHITSTVGARYKNFEILQVQNGVAVDLDDVAGITSVAMNDGNSNNTALNDLSAAQAAAVTILAGDGAAIIGVKNATNVGQIDTVKMTFDNGNTTVNEDINASASTFTLAGVEYLEVSAVDQAEIVQSAAASGALVGVKLSGAGQISFTTGNMATTNFTLDASGATGKTTLDATNFATNGIAITGGSGSDTITGSGQADIIKGNDGADSIVAGDGNDTVESGAGNDTVNGGAKADKLTGGDGNDLFVMTSSAETKGASYAGTNTTWGNVDAITDFVGNGTAAGDTINLGGGAQAFGTGITFTATTTANVIAVTVAGGSVADISAIFAQVQAASAGVASTSTVAQIYDVTLTTAYASATRLLIVNDATAAIDSADAVINITGVTGALAAQDFTFA